jgi:hypothetical protein
METKETASIISALTESVKLLNDLKKIKERDFALEKLIKVISNI